MFLIPRQPSLVKQTTLWWVMQSGRVSKTEHGVELNPDVSVGCTRALLANVKILSLERSAVSRVLASHHCALGAIPGPGVTCGLSLLLAIFVLARRIFLRALRKTTFQILIRLRTWPKGK